MLRWKTLGISVLASLLLAAVAIAPAQAQAEAEAEVEAVIDELVAAWSAGDPEAFGGLFTDEGIVAFAVSNGAPPGTTAEEARASLQDLVGGPPLEVREVRDLTVSGETASATIVISEGTTLSLDQIEFAMVDGSWLISNYMANVEPVQPPSGYEPLPVDMFDFGYEADLSSVAVGDSLAMSGENIGSEPHEIVLLKAAQDLDLQQAFASEEPPEGVEVLGFTFAPPGETSPTLLVDSLDAGRYVMVCFIPTEDGTPHWELGMFEEFTLGEDEQDGDDTDGNAGQATATPRAPSTGTPRAPSTGSGMSDGGGTGTATFAALGLGVLVVSAGGALIVRTATARKA